MGSTRGFDALVEGTAHVTLKDRFEELVSKPARGAILRRIDFSHSGTTLADLEQIVFQLVFLKREMEYVLCGTGRHPDDLSSIIRGVLAKAEIEIQILEVTAFVHLGALLSGAWLGCNKWEGAEQVFLLT